jgi:hypothetical protein
MEGAITGIMISEMATEVKEILRVLTRGVAGAYFLPRQVFSLAVRTSGMGLNPCS